MPVYFVANILVEDEQEYQQYLDQCDLIFTKFGGDYLAVDSNPVRLEGVWDYTRVVMVRFPTQDDFSRWYYSVEYQTILQHRLKSARCDTILVQGK